VLEWSNHSGKFNFENHDGNHASNHGFVDSVDTEAYCSADCDDAGAWADLDDNGWYGIKLSGTSASTTAQWWLLDSDKNGTVDAGVDAEDPDTWDDGVAGTMVCECLAAEVVLDATFTEIDGVGKCGLEATIRDTAYVQNVTSFACGDY
jgi:hypothetical protein